MLDSTHKEGNLFLHFMLADSSVIRYPYERTDSFFEAARHTLDALAVMRPIEGEKTNLVKDKGNRNKCDGEKPK